MNNKSLKKLAMIGVASAIMFTVQEGEASYRRTNQSYIANNCGAGSCGGTPPPPSDSVSYEQNHGQYQQQQNKPFQGQMNKWNGKGGYHSEQDSHKNLHQQRDIQQNLNNGNGNGNGTSAKRDPFAEPSYPANYSKHSFSPNNNRHIADNEEINHDEENLNNDQETAQADKQPATKENKRKALSPRKTISQKSPYKKINNQYYRTYITEAEDLEDLDDGDSNIINPKKLDGSKANNGFAKPTATNDEKPIHDNKEPSHLNRSSLQNSSAKAK